MSVTPMTPATLGTKKTARNDLHAGVAGVDQDREDQRADTDERHRQRPGTRRCCVRDLWNSGSVERSYGVVLEPDERRTDGQAVPVEERDDAARTQRERRRTRGSRRGSATGRASRPCGRPASPSAWKCSAPRLRPHDAGGEDAADRHDEVGRVRARARPWRCRRCSASAGGDVDDDQPPDRPERRDEQAQPSPSHFAAAAAESGRRAARFSIRRAITHQAMPTTDEDELPEGRSGTRGEDVEALVEAEHLREQRDERRGWSGRGS